MKRNYAAAFLILCLLATTKVFAAPKYYGNLIANLSPDWVCQVEGEDNVCLSNIEGEKKSSAIVITVRAKGVEDSLTFFRDQLLRPKTLEVQGLPVISQVKEVRELKINGQTWIEGIHIGSELNGYFTHYLVTTDGVNSALVSINIHQDEYKRILPTLSGFVSSLRLVSNTNLPPDSADIQTHNNSVQVVRPNSISIMGYTIRKTYALLLAGGLVVVALLAYAVFSD